MSDEKQEVPVLSLLEQMKQQHANFVSQKEFAQNNLNQLVGAIFASEVMIKKFEDEEAKKAQSQESPGGQEDGQADEQDQNEAA